MEENYIQAIFMSAPAKIKMQTKIQNAVSDSFFIFVVDSKGERLTPGIHT